MRATSAVTIWVLGLVLCACEMKLPHAATPAPPQPVAAKTEPPADSPPSEPLSIPQTQVSLPRSQPIDPEAVAVPPIPPEPSTPRTARAARHPVPQPQSSTPHAKPPENTESAEAPAAPAPEPQRPRIEPVLPADERRQLIEEIASRLKEVDLIAARASSRRMSVPEKNSLERARSLAALAHQELERGNTQQASALADRALLMAQELDRGR